MNRCFLLLLFSAGLILGCKQNSSESDPADTMPKPNSDYYTEKYRPQFHFSPEEKWMNDPNGLVYHKGEYHLFYQYYPEDIVWGPMHWGHAVSTDMHHWEHKPIALYPDDHGLIFSGSAVMDYQNTSGFGTEGESPMVAIFTYHLMKGEEEGRTDFQTQGIAYSLDGGDSWTKYEGNPVIENPGIKDFRDPKVFWHEETKKWVMVLVAGNHARFYGSENLKEWEFLSQFGQDQGAHGGVWECPDLFLLPIEDSEESRWVLTISINPGAPNGGSGTQYFIGNFDGQRFVSEQQEALWLDYGTDNYAGVTYNNTPNDRRIFIGWMSNWMYARETPTEIWRSAMTLPRSLHLSETNEGIRVLQKPLNELETLYKGNEMSIERIPASEEQSVVFKGLQQSRISLKSSSPRFELSLKNQEGDVLTYRFNRGTGSVLLDRIESGLTDFNTEFGNKQHFMPLPSKDSMELELFLDQSSAELFLNKGSKVMTSLIFPKEPYTELILKNLSEEGTLEDILIQDIRSVWR